MASTYSPALRLELMATGDQSGTWGVTTNTNLGTLLEQAITGVLSVAEGDTTLTLTANNGASDQARNAVVNLTGAMTAARNVVVQTANKVYLIKNSTTGGFTITAKTAAGTGVEIAAGTARWVYSDGTNVVDAIPGLSYGYQTTATAAGTTTLTVGSARQQYFTGTTTQTVSLPVVTTGLVLGQTWQFTNNSTGAVTINSSGGNAVLVMSAGTSASVTCILLTGTTAASWSAYGYSVGTAAAGAVLISNGVGTTPILSAAGRQFNQSVFASSGTFTTPANSTTSTVYSYTVVGAGGSGGSSSGANGAAGGGGGGGTVKGTFTGVAPSTGITITVGAGGVAVSGSSNGNAGGSSSIGAPVSVSGINGSGGLGTSAATGRVAGGAGGTASGGALGLAGGQGGNGQTDGGLIVTGGDGGGSSLAPGGTGGASGIGLTGAPGNLGAGGGASIGSGGTSGGGGQGIVVIEWVL